VPAEREFGDVEFASVQLRLGILCSTLKRCSKVLFKAMRSKSGPKLISFHRSSIVRGYGGVPRTRLVASLGTKWWASLSLVSTSNGREPRGKFGINSPR
jgi:hypothetical protein